MQESVVPVLIGIVATLVVVLLVLSVLAGSLRYLTLGLAAAKRATFDPAFAERLRRQLDNGSSKEAELAVSAAPTKSKGEGLQALALLQAEARLVDFLMEDIQAASDVQIGQAVREVHRKAREALLRHAKPEEILPGQEGDVVTVPAGFDPARIRVIGNVTGTPPYTGTLQHPGWRVNDVNLPTPPAGADHCVLQPAVVQIA